MSVKKTSAPADTRSGNIPDVSTRRCSYNKQPGDDLKVAQFTYILL